MCRPKCPLLFTCKPITAYIRHQSSQIFATGYDCMSSNPIIYMYMYMMQLYLYMYISILLPGPIWWIVVWGVESVIVIHVSSTRMFGTGTCVC